MGYFWLFCRYRILRDFWSLVASTVLRRYRITRYCVRLESGSLWDCRFKSDFCKKSGKKQATFSFAEVPLPIVKSGKFLLPAFLFYRELLVIDFNKVAFDKFFLVSGFDLAVELDTAGTDKKFSLAASSSQIFYFDKGIEFHD